MTRTFLCFIPLLVACTGEIEATAPPAHTEDDPWDELAQTEREGPPRYASRVHGCAKVRYRTLGNLLLSRGVNLGLTDPVSAGQIYRTGAGALGGPNFAGRVRETIELGLATTSKMFDVYAQAASEIIANMPNRPECQVAGVGARLFDDANQCLADGITCLIGVPATPAHIAICNQTVARANDIESGKRLAVAVLAAAAHTCE